MNEYFEKMREHLDLLDRSKMHGLSTRDVVAQTYTEGDMMKLAEDLKAGPASDFGFAAFRLCSFLFERQTERVPAEIQRLAADNVAEHVCTQAEGTDESAVHLFIAWGGHRPDHRDVSLQLLRHPETRIREIAVSYSGNFLRPNEYSKLIDFRHDRETAETGGMGGPLRFIIRDHALCTLKLLTGCSVNEDDCFEDTPHGRVFYKSWSPFLNWFEGHQR